jgi:macrolide-specific efflux system membrane fusion protein
MKTAENELDAAEVQRIRRQIVAPFDGTVVQVFVRLGEWVEPGQKALRIVNIDRLKAEGFLRAAGADASLLGAPVQLTLDLAGEQAAAFDGKVSFVSPEVDPITGQVRVWAEIDNHAGRLRPGQSVRMVIEKEVSSQ